MSLAAFCLVAYIILCIIGLHVAVNYLCSVHSDRKIEKSDIVLALLCIFLNIFVIFHYWYSDKVKVKKVKQSEEDYKQKVLNYKQSISTLIPYFEKKNYTVAALINSGNPHGYILGTHLLNNCNKELSHTLTEQDIYDCAPVVLFASPVQVASARYEQQALNKREIN